VYLLAPVEKEPAPLVIGPVPDEKELTPVYLPAPVEKELAPLVIGPAPDEKELPLWRKR
jgi:hypothetical protein